MRLSAGDSFAGYPALSVRALLRKWNDSARAEFATRIMGVGIAAAHALVQELVAAGLVEEDECWVSPSFVIRDWDVSMYATEAPSEAGS